MLKAVSVVRRLIPVGGGVRRLLGLCHGCCLLTRSWQVLFDGRVSQDSRQWGRSVERWLDARGKGPDAFSPSDGRIFLGTAMTKRSGLIALLAAILAILVFVTPIGPLPGFFIGGQPTSVPQTWPNTAKVDEILLKVPGILPRVVVIWVVQVDGALYVVGNSASGWVERLGDGAAVEMRLSGNTYALNATPVTQDLERLLNAYKDKYRPNYPDIVAGFPALAEAGDEFGVFRLVAR